MRPSDHKNRENRVKKRINDETTENLVELREGR